MLQQIKGCLKAAALIILPFLLFLMGASPSAATEAENKSVDEYFQDKDSNETTEQSDLKQEKEVGEKVGITSIDVMKMIVALVFVVLLLLLLVKFFNKKSRGYSHGQMIQNMGGTSLGGNRSLQVVRVGEKILVLGVGENVQLLDLIVDEGEYNRMIDTYNEKKMEQKSSASMKWMNDWKGERGGDNSSFAGQLSARLEEMNDERRALNKDLRRKGSGADE